MVKDSENIVAQCFGETHTALSLVESHPSLSSLLSFLLFSWSSLPQSRFLVAGINCMRGKGTLVVKIYKKKSLACKGGVACLTNRDVGALLWETWLWDLTSRGSFFCLFLCVPCGSPLSFLKMSTTIVLPYPFFPFSGFSFSRFFHSLSLYPSLVYNDAGRRRRLFLFLFLAPCFFPPIPEKKKS